MDIQQIINTLDKFHDLEDEPQIKALDEAIKQLNKMPHPAAVETLFRIFERFPTGEVHGGFWSIMHTIEKTPNYEGELVKSIHRQPCEFNVRMLNRMLNGGIHSIGEITLIDLLQRAAQDERTPTAVKKDAFNYIQRHKGGNLSA